MADQVKDQINVSFENTKNAFAHLSNDDLNFSIRLFQLMQNPTLVTLGIALSKVALAARLPINAIVKSTVFRQFCGGVDLEESLKKVAELNENNIGSILDYAVEGAQDEITFDLTKEELIAVIEKNLALLLINLI